MLTVSIRTKANDISVGAPPGVKCAINIFGLKNLEDRRIASQRGKPIEAVKMSCLEEPLYVAGTSLEMFSETRINIKEAVMGAMPFRETAVVGAACVWAVIFAKSCGAMRRAIDWDFPLVNKISNIRWYRIKSALVVGQGMYGSKLEKISIIILSCETGKHGLDRRNFRYAYYVTTYLLFGESDGRFVRTPDSNSS